MTHVAPRRISTGGALVALAIGAMVFVGWTIGSDRLISIDMRFIAMLPMTAVGIMAAAVAILLLREPVSRARHGTAIGLAVFVFALGLLVFLSRQMGRELLWVGSLYRERLIAYPYRPLGLFATNSTIAFMLTATAIVLITSTRRSLRAVARLASTAAATIAFVAILGHVYGARSLYAIDQFAGMALVTALGFGALQVGILFLRPDEGAISLLTRADLASRLMRRVVPLTLLVPIVLGFLLIQGREASLVSRETGIALFVTTVVGCLVGVLLFSARYIRRADLAASALLEQEQQLRAAAESANKTKSDFLGVMSHELRTPLNAVVGYVDLLSDGLAGPVSGDQAKYLGRIRASAVHLTRTVGDILTLTRLGTQAGAVHLETVPLDTMLPEIAAILEPLARAKSLELECECRAPLAVTADAHRLRQILINLGGNAIKFTESGRVDIAATAVGDRVRIAVRDTGIGIARENLERIFEDFWQVEGALTRNFDGAGLGLAVSRRLARQLRGDVTVESEPGRGSTFTLDLPAAEYPLGETVPADAQQSPPLSP